MVSPVTNEVAEPVARTVKPGFWAMTGAWPSCQDIWTLPAPCRTISSILESPATMSPTTTVALWSVVFVHWLMFAPAQEPAWGATIWLL